MLSAEIAAKRLEPWLIAENVDEERNVILPDALHRLPADVRAIGYGLFHRDRDGEPLESVDWTERLKTQAAAVRPLETLSAANRKSLFAALCGKLAADLEEGWQLLKTAPYQESWGRRAFRTPNKPAATFSLRSGWLMNIAAGSWRIQPEVLTPAWLASWGAYLTTIFAEQNLGRLLAAVINRGGAAGNEVFEILCQSAKNEHEIAGISRMAARALLMSNRPEGWELMERMLLAAQRQEGLRQVILETVDEAHPQAFRRMLQIVHDEKLARFSAVTRAVDVWCGLNFESDQVKAVNESISRAMQFLDQPPARAAALKSDDPEQIYAALWATAFEDAHAAIAAAAALALHRKAEVRFVAAYLLQQLQLSEAASALLPLLEDDDLRVALTALDGTHSLINDDESEAESSEQRRKRFEQIEKLFQRMPEKPKKLPAAVWPWTERMADRTHVAGTLMGALGDLPPTRLLPYLPHIHRYQRAGIVRMLAEQKKWDKLTRDTLLELTGSPSPDVREAAIDALSRVELTAAEIAHVESLLSRKASDLRIGALKLLQKQSDSQALASASRLLESKDSSMRLSGLELLRQLMEADRERKACLSRAQEYAGVVTKKTKDEQAQLETILQTPAERLTLDDAFGLLNPAELSPIPRVTARPVEFFTDATVAILKSLDELVHEHRDAQVRYQRWDGAETEELLGAMHGLPHPQWDQPPEGERAKLPLADIWENWYQNRPKSLRDRDGLELVRVERFCEMVSGYWWTQVLAWSAKHPDRKAWVHAFSSGKSPVKLKYEQLVESVVNWLLFLHRPDGVEDFLLDAAETWLALVPQCCHDELVEFAKSEETPSRYSSSGDTPVDWRVQYGACEWYAPLGHRLLYVAETPQRFERRWRLARFFSQPVPGALRHRPDLQLLLKAHEAGLATLTDLTDALLGPRSIARWGTSFGELAEITSHRPSDELKSLLRRLPQVQALVDRCRERVLEIELARGDTPTPATSAAQSMCYFGTATLGRILRVLGANGFKVTNRYAAEAKLARLPTLTEMVKSTHPREQDAQAEFDREIKACLQTGLKEQTVLELMFLAPQWTKFVENYFRWPGLSEGLYWFLAHMKYINADAESAATAGGYEAETESEGDNAKPTRSAWDRLIAERTSLTDEERTNGAIDVEWFHRVHAQLTPKRWEALAAAARFAANPAQARRAAFLGDVLLGKANRKELFAQVTQKKLKESVRLIGLYPLAAGAKRAADLAQRYKMLVDYRRYAKGLSGLTKPSAMQALDIGFRNLASTAGYIDPLRMEWALEADAVKDLAKGPVSAKKDGVTVTLSLDELARPVVTTVKNDKPLKAVPPAVKQDKRVAELLERVTELRRQTSRVKASLEAAMCRGDEFEPDELVRLCQHALLRPLLSRLVIVMDDKAGYPDKGGKSLRDHAGKFTAVRKKCKLRLAHAVDFFERGDWSKWQHECFQSGRVQPFKQVFRELYVVTKQERKDGTRSSRYAGQQVNPQQANALWNARNWHTQDEVFKAFPAEGITASVSFRYGGGTPLDVEGLTFDSISFQQRDQYQPLKLANVPPRMFSEVMRDLDLVVSVAHRGGVDPEATASTVEMREALVKETCLLLGLKNVKIKQPRALIKGRLAEYAIHLGSGNVHRLPGGALCVIPVHAQHRGRLFLPFADDDPRTAEIVSKVLLLANDHEIQDPSILEQLRG